MRRLVVNVDVGTLNIGKALELELQLLSDIVRLHQRARRVHDNVNLGDEARA